MGCLLTLPSVQILVIFARLGGPRTRAVTMVGETKELLSLKRTFNAAPMAPETTVVFSAITALTTVETK